MKEEILKGIFILGIEIACTCVLVGCIWAVCKLVDYGNWRGWWR